MIHYTTKKLSNGVRVITAPMEDTQAITVLIMTRAGSRYETARESGIAHFLEHMFFKGTKTRPQARMISEELDGLGAEYNAFTSKEYTGYYVKVEAHQWGKAVDLLSDLFLHATLAQEEIDRERGPIMEEMAMIADHPQRYIWDLWEQHLYGDHPLGRSVIGSAENIGRFSRRDLVRFLHRMYTGNAIVVCVAGRIVAPRSLSRILAERFACVTPGAAPQFRVVHEQQKKPAVSVHYKETDQVQCVIGFRAYPAEHPRRDAAIVLAALLGGMMSSRLFTEVRERRGLVYSIYASTDFSHDVGTITIALGASPARVAEAIRIIFTELRRLRTEPISLEEMTKVKQYLTGKFALGLEGSSDVAEFLVMQEVLRAHIVQPEERLQRIARVTSDDLRVIAQEIFVNERLNAVAIGPRAACALVKKNVLAGL